MTDAAAALATPLCITKVNGLRDQLGTLVLPLLFPHTNLCVCDL